MEPEEESLSSEAESSGSVRERRETGLEETVPAVSES